MKKKTFAFKLAAKRDIRRNHPKKKWVVRDGLAAAGCTPNGLGDFRDGRNGSWDNGIYC